MYEYAELIKTNEGWKIIKKKDVSISVGNSVYLIDVLNNITRYGWNLVSVLNENNNVTYIIRLHKLSLKKLLKMKGES